MLDDEEIPCDLVVMSCEDAEGTCYITTANLDGETNLKVLCFNTISLVYRPHPQLSSMISEKKLQKNSKKVCRLLAEVRNNLTKSVFPMTSI